MKCRRQINGFTREKFFVVVLLFMFSCKSPRFFYCDVSRQFITDTLVESSNCKYYYDPFAGKKDTIFIDVETFAAAPLKIVKRTNSGNGYLTAYVADSIAFLRCELKKGKLNGLCTRYYLRKGVQTFKMANFKNNRLSGLYVYIHPMGDTLEKKLYKNGRLLKNYKIE